jgi:hypothetical protein
MLVFSISISNGLNNCSHQASASRARFFIFVAFDIQESFSKDGVPGPSCCVVCASAREDLPSTLLDICHGATAERNRQWTPSTRRGSAGLLPLSRTPRRALCPAFFYAPRAVRQSKPRTGNACERKLPMRQ